MTTAVSTEREPRRDIPFATPLAVVFTVVLIAYATWMAYTGHGRFRHLRVGYGVDSYYYIKAAKAPVWSMEFLATPNGAPFLFPLLAKLCLRNMRAIVIVQSALAAWSWLFLARTVGVRMRTPAARTFAYVSLLLLAISPSILLWNVVIGTESLALSLLCIATALLIRLTGGSPGRHDFVAFVAVLVALACTRDSYSLVLLVVMVGVLALGIARSDLRFRCAIVAVVCLVSALGNIASSNHGGRWFDPLDETIGVRLLGSKEATHYFVSHGMPLTPQVKSLHEPGAIVFLAYSVTYGPEYKDYREWLLAKGRGTYTSYLLTHPVSDIQGPFDQRQTLLIPNLRDYGRTYFIEPRGPFHWLGKIGMPESESVIEIWMGLALVASVLLWRRRRDRGLLIAMGISTLVMVVHFLVAWHGDALELDRHIISAALELRIILWVVTALALDAALEALRERRRVPKGADGTLS